MAKRYTRINYQDGPSTATPLSAANLNKMDKGIDDLDNAVEVINDNLAQKLNFNDSVADETKTISSILATITQSQSIGFFHVLPGTTDAPITNTNGVVIFFKNNVISSAAVVIYISRNIGNIGIKAGAYQSGTLTWQT